MRLHLSLPLVLAVAVSACSGAPGSNSMLPAAPIAQAHAVHLQDSFGGIPVTSPNTLMPTQPVSSANPACRLAKPGDSFGGIPITKRPTTTSPASASSKNPNCAVAAPSDSFGGIPITK